MKETFIYMAPLQGATDFAYRNTSGKYFKGVDSTLSPFITGVKEKKVKPTNMRDVSSSNNSTNLVPQILGNEASAFIEVAKRLFDDGYNHINWNLGCPSPMVVNKKRGSGLLPYYDKINELLDEIVASIPNKLSIKMRLGLYDFEDEGKRLIHILNNYPLKEIMVHPRTGKQMYTGSVDLDSFGEILKISKNEIVYNGDINSVDDFIKIKERFPEVNKWMLGRGLLSNPFLASMIKGIEIDEGSMQRILKEFYDDLYSQYKEIQKGPTHLLDKMKAQWFYFSRVFVDGERLYKKIKKKTSVDKYEKLVEDFFSKNLNLKINV